MHSNARVLIQLHFAMGYEVERFVNQPDEEFLCSICLGVFESPVHGPCGHTFCSKCIENWIPVNVNTCPLDKKTLHKKDLVTVSIPFRNLLNRLMIKCDFESVGCTTVSMIGCLADHIKVCPFNPDGEMVCDQGCELTFPRRDRESHKCLVALKEVISKQRLEINDLQKKIGGTKRPYETAFSRLGYTGERSPNFSDSVPYHPMEYGDLARRRTELFQGPRIRNRPSIISYESTTSRTRTPPPNTRTLLLSSGPATSSGSHFNLHDIGNIEVQLQRLTDEDLESYGVSRSSLPSSSSRNPNGLTGNNGNNCTSSTSNGTSNGNNNGTNNGNNSSNGNRSNGPAGSIGNNNATSSSNSLGNDQRRQQRHFPVRQQVADDTFMLFDGLPFSGSSSSSSSSSPSSSTNHGISVQQQPCSSSSVSSIGSSNVSASSTTSNTADRFNLLSAILAREPGCSRAN